MYYHVGVTALCSRRTEELWYLAWAMGALSCHSTRFCMVKALEHSELHQYRYTYNLYSQIMTPWDPGSPRVTEVAKAAAS